MSLRGPADVYTVDEIACAAGVPAESVESLIASGVLRHLPGTSFFRTDDILPAIPSLRAAAIQVGGVRPRPGLFAVASTHDAPSRPVARVSLLASSAAHVLLCLLILWLTSGSTATAPASPELEASLVYLNSRLRRRGWRQWGPEPEVTHPTRAQGRRSGKRERSRRDAGARSREASP